MRDDHFPDDDFDRLARYVSGEAGETERAESGLWIAASPERTLLAEELRSLWIAAGAVSPVDVDRGWSRFGSRLRGETNADGPVLVLSERQWWRNTARLMPLAAGLALVIGASVVWSRLRDGWGSRSGEGAASTALATFVTPAAKRHVIDLSDGTRVVLGVSSSLRVRAGFDSSARELELSGEASFTVAHDAAHRLRVHVGQTVVEDIGTEFAIRSYNTESTVRVAVRSGSVAVRRGSRPTPAAVLSPNDVAVVGDTGDIRISRGIRIDRYLAFANGRLVFEDTPLSDVAEELHRWYGVDVRVTDPSLLSRHYSNTTGFEDESLDEVLRVIGMSLNVRYVKRGSTVEFIGPGKDGGGGGRDGGTSSGTAAPRLPVAQPAESGA